MLEQDITFELIKAYNNGEWSNPILQKAFQEIFEKARKSYPIGTVRKWNGKEYIKTANGWRLKTKKQQGSQKSSSDREMPFLSEKMKEILYSDSLSKTAKIRQLYSLGLSKKDLVVLIPAHYSTIHYALQSSLDPKINKPIKIKATPVKKATRLSFEQIKQKCDKLGFRIVLESKESKQIAEEYQVAQIAEIINDLFLSIQKEDSKYEFEDATIQIKKQPSGPRLDIALKYTDGFKIYKIERIFDTFLEKPQVHHNVLQIPPSIQSKRLARNFLKKSLEYYKQIDIRAISVMANIDIGGYAWAKYGFCTEQRHIDTLLRETGHRLFFPMKEHFRKNSLPVSLTSLDEIINPIVESYKKIAKDRVKAFLDNGGSKSYIPVSLLTDIYIENPYLQDDIGKHVLLGSQWPGRIKLDDPEHLQRFEQYLNK